VKVIVGLGNPGREYEATRHNVGWWVVDHLADVWRFDGWRRDGAALVATGTVGRLPVRLVKPQTYMNLSGRALEPYQARPFWMPERDLLVLVDDVSLPVGQVRLRARGSAGGHNGLKSIERTLRSPEYGRVRIGIAPRDEEGRALRPDGDLADFVLAPFGEADRGEIVSLMPRCTSAVEHWLTDGIDAAMNLHNR